MLLSSQMPQMIKRLLSFIRALPRISILSPKQDHVLCLLVIPVLQALASSKP